MSGPSPYNALFEIFGNGWQTKDEDHQQHIKIVKKSVKKHSKIQNEKEQKFNSKKPMQIDNACQTQPLRDYSYNKVVVSSKRKANIKNYEKDENFKIICNDNATILSKNIVHNKSTSSSIGTHLKNSHVSALYKTVSDIEKIFREERNLHLHSRKCLCNSCGALGVITESMKHPVDFDDSSTESDDDDDDDDENDDYDDDEYYAEPPRYNSSERNWKIEYKDNESIRYGISGTEGYVRLLLELEKMIKRVRSLERLVIKNNIPLKRNKIDMTYDIHTHNLNSVSKKFERASTSSSEIDKKKCGLFSIPNVIKRRFSKKRVKQETNDKMTKVPTTKLRSNNYKHKTKDIPMDIDIDKNYQSKCLDEKIQNFDLALLNEDEICELMFHLKNQATNKSKRMNQRTVVSPHIERNDRLYQKPVTPKSKSNQIHKPDHTPLKMKSSDHRSLRRDETYIRRSHNYQDNNIETNRNTRNLFNNFLKINNVTPVKHYHETNKQQNKKILHSDNDDNEESAHLYTVNNSQNILRELNLDISKHEQTSAKNKMKTSKESLFYKSSKSANHSKKEWANDIINNSSGVMEEKYNHEMKISDNTISSKMGETVIYSKQNEYLYFKNSLMDMDSNSKSYNNPIEIGESSGLCKQMRQVKEIKSSDSNLSREYGTYFKMENISATGQKFSEILLPLIEKSSQPQIEIKVRKIKDMNSSVQNSLINEDQNKKVVKVTEVPSNYYNQFKYQPETYPRRSELRTNNDNKTYKQSINHDKKVSGFISNNIFEKYPKDTSRAKVEFIENGKDKTKIEKENLRKDSNGNKKGNKVNNNIVEFKKSNRFINEEIKSCEVSKDMIRNKIINKKENKEIQVVDKNKEKENKGIQVADKNEGKEKKIFFKKDNEEIKNIQNFEKKNIVTNENIYNKNSKESKDIQKNIVESKSFTSKGNEKEKASKMCEVNKNIMKKKSSVIRKENKGTQVTQINEEKQNKNYIIKNIRDIKAIQKIDHSKMKVNEIFNNKISENSSNSRSSYRNAREKSSNTSDINKNISYKRKENKMSQVTEINKEKENNKEIKCMPKNEHKNIVEKGNINITDSVKTRNPQKIEINKFVGESKISHRNCNEVACEVNKSALKNISSKKKEHKETQIMKINEEKENIIEEIHECPMSFIFNNFPSFNKKDNSQEVKKSILKTYKRTINESPLKLDKRNSVAINKFKKHVNINIVRKVSSSIIYDIFNKRTGRNVVLTKVFKRKKLIKNDTKNEIKLSKIPIRIFNQTKNITLPNITTNVSRIPICTNKTQAETILRNKISLKIPEKTYNNNNNNNQIHRNIFLNYNAITNKPTLKLTNKIGNSQDTDLNKNFVLPKLVSTKNKYRSKIPTLQKIHKNKFENEVCNEPIKSTSFGSNNLLNSDKKTTIHPSFINTNNDMLLTFSQNSKLFPVFISMATSNVKKQEDNKTLPLETNILNSSVSGIKQDKSSKQTDTIKDTKVIPLNSDILKSFNLEIEKIVHKMVTNSTNDAKVLPVDSDILNSYNSQVEKSECKIFTKSIDEAKVFSADSDILNSYNSQIEKIEHKIITDSTDETKELPVDFDILNSYNSQIEKVERSKIVTDSTVDYQNSNDQTSESFIIPNDVTDEKSFYTTPPCAIETYASSCTFSEGSSGAVFFYKSKCQLGTDISIENSDLDTRESVPTYTSMSELNPSRENKKWKWVKKFRSKFKSFFSVHTPKSSTVENLLMDTSCNAFCCIPPTSNNTFVTVETNDTNKGKFSKKNVNEENKRKNNKAKWSNVPKVSSLSFTFTLKKKNTNPSMYC